MVPDFRASQRTEQNPIGIPREGIKMRGGLKKGTEKDRKRINLVDIRTEVTNRSN